MSPANLTRFFVLLAILVFVGCESQNKGKIEGTKWTSEMTTVDGKLIPSGTSRLEFRTDGSLLFTAGPQTYNGSYTLSMGDMVILDLTESFNGSKRHVQRITISGDHLPLADTDGTKIPYVKVR